MVNFENYAELLWDLIDDFESKTIYESFSNCGSSSDKETINKHIEKTNINIPDILKKIISEYGVLFKWKVVNSKNQNRIFFAHNTFCSSEYFYYGGFQNRNSVKDNDDYNPPFYPQNCSDKELKYWQQFYILDDLYFGKLILIKPDEKENNHELYLFDHPNTIAKLSITLEQYFELTNKTLGMYCWQEYVTEESYKQDGAIPDNFHENMALLFPEEDLSIFRNKPKLEESVYNTFVAKTNKEDYRARFIAKMDELKYNPNIKFVHYENTPEYKATQLPYIANYGVTEAVLRKIKKDYGREISESMLAFYYQMNGCRVFWEYNEGETSIYTKMNLLELEEVMGGKWKESYLEWNSENLFKDEDSVYYFKEDEAAENPKMAELMKTARIFDQYGEMRDYFLQFVDGQKEPNIYKISRTSFYKMNIDFKTYIEARIEFCGMTGWEYNFIDHEDFDQDSKERWVNDFKNKAKLVYKNPDFSIIE